MSPEIERLLGGYATNTLTQDEKILLLQAALDDQDVFNALEGEEALRDLLSDSTSHDEIRRALEQQRSPQRKRSRFWGWPAIGTAGAVAVAVGVLLLPLPPPKPPVPPHIEIAVAPPPQLIAPPVASAPAAPPAIPKPKIQRRPAETAQVPALQRMAAATAVNTFSAGAPAPRPVSAMTGVMGGAAGFATLSPKLFAVLRQDSQGAYAELAPSALVQPGDSIRIQPRAPFSNFTLSRKTETGEWAPIPADTLVSVTAPTTLRLQLNPSYQVEITLTPGQPVAVQPVR